MHTTTGTNIESVMRASRTLRGVIEADVVKPSEMFIDIAGVLSALSGVAYSNVSQHYGYAGLGGSNAKNGKTAPVLVMDSGYDPATAPMFSWIRELTSQFVEGEDIRVRVVAGLFGAIRPTITDKLRLTVIYYPKNGAPTTILSSSLSSLLTSGFATYEWSLRKLCTDANFALPRRGGRLVFRLNTNVAPYSGSTTEIERIAVISSTHLSTYPTSARVA